MRTRRIRSGAGVAGRAVSVAPRLDDQLVFVVLHRAAVEAAVDVDRSEPGLLEQPSDIERAASIPSWRSSAWIDTPASRLAA